MINVLLDTIAHSQQCQQYIKELKQIITVRRDTTVHKALRVRKD